MKYIHHEYLTPDATDVLKPLPTPHPLSGISACKPTKSLHYHRLVQHGMLLLWKCRCGATFKYPRTAVNGSRTFFF